jgi:hypothetical protein
MYSEFAAELWNEFKSLLNPVDKDQAADMLISMLIDCDENIDDIKKAFKNDELIKNALAFYVDNPDDVDYDEEDDVQDYDE